MCMNKVTVLHKTWIDYWSELVERVINFNNSGRFKRKGMMTLDNKFESKKEKLEQVLVISIFILQKV